MKNLTSPRKLFWAGAICVFLGFALPMMIILGFIENSFALSFFIYALQLVGMILGAIAAAGLVIRRRNKKEDSVQSDKENPQESDIGWMD